MQQISNIIDGKYTYPQVDEMNYFGGVKGKKNNEDLEDKLNVCQALCETIHNVGSNNSGDRDLKIAYQALAFLVEASYQLDPENWKDHLKTLNVQLLSKASGSNPDIDGINWTLTQLIDNLYKTALTYNMLKAQADHDDNKKESLRRSLKMYEVLENFSKKCHQNHRLYSFGGIRPDYVPGWYQTMFQGSIRRLH